MNYEKKKRDFVLLRIFNLISDACAHLAAWMMLWMALIITFEVTVRYFFNSPTSWVNDFTDYTMLYSTFFIAAWLLKHGGHVRLTILSEHLSPRSEKILEIINYFIGAIVCGILFFYGIIDVLDAIEKNIELARPFPVPKYLILMVIPFGFLILLFQFLIDLFKFFKELRAPASTQQRWPDGKPSGTL